MTIRTLVLQYIAWLQARPSNVYFRQVYHHYLERQTWMDDPADCFNRADLILLKQDLAHVPSQGRRCIQLISQSYSWASQTVDRATRTVLYNGPNPVVGIRKPSAGRREEKMDLSQLRLFLESIEFLSLKHRAILLVRLLSPNRITEVCHMRREHLDLVSGKWFKPHTKTGLKQYTYIPRQAREAITAHLFATERRRGRYSEYIFEGIDGRPIRPASFRRIWWELRKQLRMPQIQLLDFRRTLASYLYNEIKADKLFAKAVLNHFDPDVTAIYVRLDYEKLATTLQAYADWIWTLRSPQGGVGTSTFLRPSDTLAHHTNSPTT